MRRPVKNFQDLVLTKILELNTSSILDTDS